MNKLRSGFNFNYTVVILIFFFLWMRFIPELSYIYQSLNIFNLKNSTIYIEDVLIILLYVNLFINFFEKKKFDIIFNKNYYFNFYIFYNFFGILFLIYAINIDQTNNLLSELRIFVFSIIPFVFIKFSKKEIKGLIFFLILIFFLDLLYQYLYRILDGSIFETNKKNSYYFNRLQFIFLFNIFIFFILEKIKKRSYLLFLFPLIFFLLLIDESRGLWLSIFVSLIIFILYLIVNFIKLNIKFYHILWFIVSILSVTTLLSFNEYITYIINYRIQPIIDISGSVYGRLEAWSLLIERILQNPLFGHGIGNSDHLIGQFFIDKNNEKIYLGTAHNSFLIIAYQIGLIGLMVFLFPFIFILIIYFRYIYNHGFDIYSAISISIISSILIFSFFSPTSIELYYFYWLSLSIAFYFLKDKYEK